MAEKEITRGDDEEFEIRVIDGNKQPVPIADVKIWFTMKSSKDDADPGILQLTSDDSTQIEITDGPGGIAVLYIKDTDSVDFTPGDYFFDIQIKFASGRVKTVKNTTIEVLADVTRTTA